jgi:flagellar protein FlaJ
MRKLLKKITKTVFDERTFTDIIDVLFNWATYPISERNYQKSLKQANKTETTAEYMSRTGFYAVTAGFIGMIITSFAMFLAGAYIKLYVDDFSFEIPEIPLTIPDIPISFGFIYDIPFMAQIIGLVYSILLEVYTVLSYLFIANLPLIIQLVLIFVGGGLFFTVTYVLMWYIPKYIASEREREIDTMLPYAITYMYSMTAGGRNIVNMFEKLAQRENVYGEISTESRIIVNKVRLGTDIRTALQEHIDNTPSEGLSEFLDELVVLLEHSDDIDGFFERKTTDALQQSKQKMESMNDFLEIIQNFIVMIPILPVAIVILSIVGMVGGGGFTFLVYTSPPLVVVAYGFLIVFNGIIFGSSEPDVEKLEVQELSDYVQVDELPNHVKGYEINDRFADSQDKSILEYSISKPLIAFAITIPFTLGYIPILYLSFEQGMIIDDALNFAMFYIYTPIAILFGLYTLLYEYKAYRIRSVRTELESLFNGIKDANKQGISLIDSIELEASNRDTVLSNTIERYIKTINLTSNQLSVTLEKIANEFEVSRLKRSIRLLTDTIEQTSNISRILEVITEDLKTRRELDTKRKQSANMTIVILFMSSLVMVGVFGIVDVMLLEQFDQLAERFEDSGGRAASTGFEDMNTTLIRASMVYSSLFSMLMIGLQVGHLRTNNISSGLKYALILGLVVGIIPFYLI